MLVSKAKKAILNGKHVIVCGWVDEVNQILDNIDKLNKKENEISQKEEDKLEKLKQQEALKEKRMKEKEKNIKEG